MGNTCKEVLGGEDLQFEIVNDKDQSKYAFKRSLRASNPDERIYYQKDDERFDPDLKEKVKKSVMRKKSLVNVKNSEYQNGTVKVIVPCPVQDM